MKATAKAAVPAVEAAPAPGPQAQRRERRRVLVTAGENAPVARRAHLDEVALFAPGSAGPAGAKCTNIALEAREVPHPRSDGWAPESIHLTPMAPLLVKRGGGESPSGRGAPPPSPPSPRPRGLGEQGAGGEGEQVPDARPPVLAAEAPAQHEGAATAQRAAEAPAQQEGATEGATPQALFEMATAEGGAPLPWRAALEAYLGAPLGEIRVYSGAGARTALAALGATAAARGAQIILAAPRPDPATLVHEVIHVLQARRGAPGVIALAAPGSTAEREAERIAARAPGATGRDGVLAAQVSAGLSPQTVALRRTSVDPATTGASPGEALAAPAPAAPAAAEPAPAPPAAPAGPASARPAPPAARAPAPDRPAAAPPVGAQASTAAGPGSAAVPGPAPAGAGGQAAPGMAAPAGAAAGEAEPLALEGDSPQAVVEAFAAASPSAQARAYAGLGASLQGAAAAEQAAQAASLPTYTAQLEGAAQAPPPLASDALAPAFAPVAPLAPEAAPAPQPVEAPEQAARRPGPAEFAPPPEGAPAAEAAAELGAALRETQAAQRVEASPGPPPAIPTGAADPGQLDSQAAGGAAQAAAARDQAAQAVQAGPGPEQVQPEALREERPVGALAEPALSAPQPVAGAEAYQALNLPPEVQASFDERVQAERAGQWGEAQTQLAQASETRDRDRQAALDQADHDAAELNRTAERDQAAAVEGQRARISAEREATVARQEQAVAEVERESGEEQRANRQAIETRVADDQRQIDGEYGRAEGEAQAEVRRGEERADRERRDAERDAADESWWDRAVSFVRDALRAFADALNAIFDAVRSAVNAIIDAAIAFANRVIDAAVRFVNDAIAAFGRLLTGLVQGLLGRIFPELAAALCAFINSAVALAQRAVQAVGDALKAGIAAVAEGVRGALNAVIGAFQQAAQLAVGLIEAAVTGDFSALARRVLEAALALVGVSPEQFYAFIGRAEETFQLIVSDPGAFVGHLIDAFVGGVRRFADNFLTHLQAGVIGWLTGAIGGAGLTLPERFDLMGVLGLVQQILGLTWERIRQELARVIGEQAVQVIEFVWGYIQTLIEGGWPALFERIREDLSTLVDTVLDGIKSFLLERVVMAAITRLATMFNPVGAIVQLLLAAWNLYTFIRDQLQRIAAVLQTVVEAVGNIARGVIEPASQRVEGVLASLLPLAIDLLARLLGLGGVGERVREIIERVQETIWGAIRGLFRRARALFRPGAAAPGRQQVAQGAGAAPEREAATLPTQLVEPTVARLVDLSPALMREIDEASNGAVIYQAGGSAQAVVSALLRQHPDARFDRGSGQLTLPGTQVEPLRRAATLRELGALLGAQTGVARIMLRKSEPGFSFVGQINPPTVIAAGQEVTLVAQIGIRGADNRVITQVAKTGDLEDILLQFRQEQLGTDDITYEEIRRNRNYALANIQVSGRTRTGLSVVFTRQVASGDLLTIFSSGTGSGPNEEVRLRIEVIGAGGQNQVVREGPATIGSTVFVEPPRVLIADPAELSRFITSMASAINGRKKYSAMLDRHSEQAVWQLIRMQDAEIAHWIRDLGVAQIYQMVVNIHSEREMCRVCAAASNHMIRNMQRQLPLVYDALQAFQIQFTAATQVSSSQEFAQRAPRAEEGEEATTQVTEASRRGEPARSVTPERVAGVVREQEEQLAPPDHPRPRGRQGRR